MKIVRKQIRSTNNTFVITDRVKELLCVRYEGGLYHAYYETDENAPNAKLVIKFLEADKYYSEGELSGYSYKESIEKFSAYQPIFISNGDINVHIYYKIIPELAGEKTGKSTAKRVSSTRKSPIDNNILNTILNS